MVPGVPTPGATPNPTSGAPGMPGAGAPPAPGMNPMAAIIAKLMGLIGGGPKMGPGIIPAHTNMLNNFANPENLNPQGTPIPTPSPMPTPGGANPSLSMLPQGADKRIGGREMSGHDVGVLGADKGFSRTAEGKPGGIRMKSPVMAAAPKKGQKAPAKA